jgi:hypothetical protein
MSVKKNEPVCKIICEEGKHYLTDVNGNKLPGQIMTRVTQGLDSYAVAIVKIFVNVVDSK